MSKTVYYASVGPALTRYDVDVENAALEKRETVTLPANIQYAWPHPSRRVLYVVSSTGGPGIKGDAHYANALAINPATGALTPHGEAARLPSRPIHCSTDSAGCFLFTAFNAPSAITVHRLNADGTIGAAVPQRGDLDTGIYAHQVIVAPGDRVVWLVTRGNNAEDGKPEDPGAIKIFRFADGQLSNAASIAPDEGDGKGYGFGPRHLDVHRERPWVFVSVERQNKLFVYGRDDEGGLSPAPLFVKETLSDPKTSVPQGVGPIHVHPGGQFVYLTNRTFPASGPGARKLAPGGENSIAVLLSTTRASRNSSRTATATASSCAPSASIRPAAFWSPPAPCRSLTARCPPGCRCSRSPRTASSASRANTTSMSAMRSNSGAAW